MSVNEKTLRQLNLTQTAANKIISLSNKSGKEKNKIYAAKQMLVYYLGDIQVLLRKEKYNQDDVLLLILKTSMCLCAIRYLFNVAIGENCSEYFSEDEKLKITRFRTLRSITTAHPFDTRRGSECDFGRNGTEWYVDIHPFCKMDTTMTGTCCGFSEDEAYNKNKSPDFVMMVCSENNDFTHRRCVYIYEDIISPLEISLRLLKKGINGKLSKPDSKNNIFT